MSTAQHRLEKAVSKLGYTQVSASKLSGTWSITAYDPLEEKQVAWDTLGTSLEGALSALSSIQPIPRFYVCGHTYECPSCKFSGKPVGFIERETKDFIHRCQSCRHTWVAMTAEEQEEEAKQRMEEAIYGLR